MNMDAFKTAANTKENSQRMTRQVSVEKMTELQDLPNFMRNIVNQ